MLLVHFTRESNLQNILHEGLNIFTPFAGYQMIDADGNKRSSCPEKERPKSIFAYPLIEDGQARYNCWADLNNPDFEVFFEEERNVGIIFRVPDDTPVWAGAWGWPFEGSALVDAEYIAQKNAYKKKFTFEEMVNEGCTKAQELSVWSNGEYNSWYDLIHYLADDEDDFNKYSALSWPMWACTGFEVCLQKEVPASDILGVHKVASINDINIPWFKEGALSLSTAHM